MPLKYFTPTLDKEPKKEPQGSHLRNPLRFSVSMNSFTAPHGNKTYSLATVR